jgi:hypothetical protein
MRGLSLTCDLTSTDPIGRGQAMAKPILEDQSVDYSKGFVLGYYEGDRYVERVTYPLKSSVKAMAERGVRAPWDQEVR